ncbi:MAG: FlgD immunoglobulin-like domain containing protein [Brevinematia bacterium]
MKRFFVLASILVVLAVQSSGIDMTNKNLIIDFSPPTTNLIYDRVNAIITSPPNQCLLLSSTYSSFKVTNIRIDKKKNEFFHNLFINVDLKPSTTVECYIMDGKSRANLKRLYLNSSQKSYFFDLYKALPKNTEEIYFIFQSYSSYTDAGKINLIVLTKETFYDTVIGENEVKVYPNPVFTSSGTEPKIVVNLSSDCYLTLIIFDSAGNIVRTLVKESFYEKGIQSFTWDLKDEKGKDISSGKYIIFSKIGESTYTTSLLVIR